MAVRAGRIGLLRPLKDPDFAKLWAAVTISMLGDGIYLVAIAWQVLQISNTATALSVVGLAVTLPALVFPLFGGVLSDRLDRRRVLIGADVLRLVAVSILGVLSNAGSLELWHVICVALAFGIGESFFLPAFGAIIPDLVVRELLVQANSLNQFMRPFAFRLVGPVVGGWTVAALGAGNAFFMDGATFAISAVLVAMIRVKPREVPEPGDESASAWSFLSDIKAGFGYVRSESWLWASLLAAALGQMAFWGPFEVLLPYIVKNQLNEGARSFGLIISAGGVGAILAALCVGQRGMGRRPLRTTYVCWGLGTGMLATYALATMTWHAMVATFLMLALFSAGIIFWSTIMQRLVPPHLLGRVGSFDMMVSYGLLPLSFAVTGPLADAIGATPTLVGAGLLGCAAVLIFLLVPGVHAADAELAATGQSGPPTLESISG